MSLFELAKQHIITVAHRGVAGGNIPCNTFTAYETALKQGADMIETDVDISADGTLIVFHPGMEKPHLGIDRRLNTLPYAEIESLRYTNQDGVPTQFGIERFEELLCCFGGRCYINVDKFWDNPEAIYEAVKKAGATDKVLVKSHLSDTVLHTLERVAPDLPFMPIVRDSHPRHAELMERNVNYVGAEVLFASEEAEVASDSFISAMHGDGKLVWVNSIIYNYKTQLAAGHSDDTALSEDMDKGWGWLADKGFDIIQTDWPGMLVEYLKQTGRYFK